jgi:23S rRNA (uridine2552-2'-O)-methyltransferase
VVGERIGEHGRAVGVDTAPISPLGAPNLGVLAGDVRDPATIEAIRARLGRPADVVLSDLSPKLTGVRATDEARGVELVRAAVLALPHLLRPGGRFVTKVFMTDDYDAWVADLRRHFTRLDATRPEATRRGSAELYVVGLGYRPPSA